MALLSSFASAGYEITIIDRSKYFGINFVIVDRKDGVIEGAIPPEIAEQFRKRITKGSVYKIQHYLIERPKNTYKAADHPHRFSFIKTTVVTHIIPQPVDFPLIAHNALPFLELEKLIGSKVLMSDTVGLMVSVTDLLPPAGAAKEPRRQITITDGQVKNQPYKIEVRGSGQARQEKIETTISAFKGVDPATTLKTLFKFRVKITQVVSLTDSVYMGCKICCKGLGTPGGGLRTCPNCPDGGEPWPSI
uniref:Replication protein A 70 kDa DNA-binding subunit B/D first OB fold domain-containing protein n=1 Tax=Hordeum vulgare subsp. vulgare TaxID=112509 RepID=A0A8I7B6K6_HORVV